MVPRRFETLTLEYQSRFQNVPFKMQPAPPLHRGIHRALVDSSPAHLPLDEVGRCTLESS
jgi:hypothetical protein